MGFITRRLVPRPIRFVRHPVRFTAWSAAYSGRRRRHKSPYAGPSLIVIWAYAAVAILSLAIAVGIAVSAA